MIIYRVLNLNYFKENVYYTSNTNSIQYIMVVLFLNPVNTCVTEIHFALNLILSFNLTS